MINISFSEAILDGKHNYIFSCLALRENNVKRYTLIKILYSLIHFIIIKPHSNDRITKEDLYICFERSKVF